MKLPIIVLAVAVALAGCETAPPDGEIVTDPLTQTAAEETESKDVSNEAAEDEDETTFEEVAVKAGKVIIVLPLIALAIALHNPHAVYYVIDALD